MVDKIEKDLLTAQESIIGSLLISPEITGDVMMRCNAEDFSGTYRTLYDGCVKLYGDMQPIDPVTLLGVVGNAYRDVVVDTLKHTPTAANWEAYATLLKETSLLRRLNSAGLKIAEAATLDDAKAATENAATLLADREGLSITSFSAGLADFYHRQINPPDKSYLRWGFAPLNDRLYISKGDFVVIGGRPSAGKTLIAAQFAYAMSTSHRVGFFSLETNNQKLYDRLISHAVKIPFDDIKRHGVSAEHLQEVVNFGAVADSHSFDVIEAAGMSVTDIQAISLAKHYDVIFIDYLQLLKAAGNSRYEITTNISLALHTMANVTGITVIALAQLSRPDKMSKRKEPTMIDLRESGQIEQDADCIMLLYLDDIEDRNGDRMLSIEKNKEGECGRIRLGFHPKTMSFFYKGSNAPPAPPARFGKLESAPSQVQNLFEGGNNYAN